MTQTQPVPVRSEKPLAFEDVVHEYQSMVFGIALNSLRDRSLAEEVAQDVFLQLHRCFGEIEGREHVKYWLCRTTSHRCIDQARRRRVRPQISLEEAPPLASRDRERDPFLMRTIRRLVSSLPERSRMIVVLRYQEDLEPHEIAEILDMPVKTVRSRLHRALNLLREKTSRTTGTTGEMEQ